MINLLERKKNVISIISSLDISPSAFKEACEKYMAIAQYLNNHGIQAEIYPQGSFSLGTVVRPYNNESSDNYDLDFICQILGSKEDYSPSELRNLIETALKENKIYNSRLIVYDECFTIVYADNNNLGFSIDIVPATDETAHTKDNLKSKSLNPTLLDTAIAIPKNNGERNYSWLTNNPKGLTAWFKNINQPFLDFSRKEYRLKLLNENPDLFCSIEEIPQELERSPLQRVIQILKRHRDVYYAKVSSGDEIKPISAIITVLAAKIASHHNPNCTEFELLSYVLTEILTQSTSTTISKTAHIYSEFDLIKKLDNKWYIENPANPDDNLADKWNENSKTAEYFFKWIKQVKADIIDSMNIEDDYIFRTAIENSFGKKSVEKILNTNQTRKAAPTPINIKTAPKPYKEI